MDLKLSILVLLPFWSKDAMQAYPVYYSVRASVKGKSRALISSSPRNCRFSTMRWALLCTKRTPNAIGKLPESGFEDLIHSSEGAFAWRMLHATSNGESANSVGLWTHAPCVKPLWSSHNLFYRVNANMYISCLLGFILSGFCSASPFPPRTNEQKMTLLLFFAFQCLPPPLLVSPSCSWHYWEARQFYWPSCIFTEELHNLSNFYEL